MNLRLSSVGCVLYFGMFYCGQARGANTVDVEKGCPLGKTTEGSCTASCIEPAMGKSSCPKTCTVMKPIMYAVDGNPVVTEIENINGAYKTSELAQDSSTTLGRYYDEAYSYVVKNAEKSGDMSYASQLRSEREQLKQNAEKYKSSNNLVELYVSASRTFRGFPKVGVYSGKMKAKITVKYKCTSIDTPLLNNAIKDAGITVEVKPQGWPIPE